jgi:hypothetical protein
MGTKSGEILRGKCQLLVLLTAERGRAERGLRKPR